MDGYKLTIYFSAENDEDADTQAATALNAFDDGFQEAWITKRSEVNTYDRDARRLDPA